MNNLVITYSPIYLDWQLGSGHPTNTFRAKLATELLNEQLKGQVTVVDPAPGGKRNQDITILNELHNENYVDNHVRGNLRLANDKTQEHSVKSLTHYNPTMKMKFEDLGDKGLANN